MAPKLVLRCQVGNLAPGTTKNDIARVLCDYDILDITLAPKNGGFVTFQAPDIFDAAVFRANMNGTLCKKRRLRVQYASDETFDTWKEEPENANLGWGRFAEAIRRRDKASNLTAVEKNALLSSSPTVIRQTYKDGKGFEVTEDITEPPRKPATKVELPDLKVEDDGAKVVSEIQATPAPDGSDTAVAQRRQLGAVAIYTKSPRLEIPPEFFIRVPPPWFFTLVSPPQMFTHVFLPPATAVRFSELDEMQGSVNDVLKFQTSATPEIADTTVAPMEPGAMVLYTGPPRPIITTKCLTPVVLLETTTRAILELGDGDGVAKPVPEIQTPAGPDNVDTTARLGVMVVYHRPTCPAISIQFLTPVLILAASICLEPLLTKISNMITSVLPLPALLAVMVLLVAFYPKETGFFLGKYGVVILDQFEEGRALGVAAARNAKARRVVPEDTVAQDIPPNDTGSGSVILSSPDDSQPPNHSTSPAVGDRMPGDFGCSRGGRG